VNSSGTTLCAMRIAFGCEKFEYACLAPGSPPELVEVKAFATRPWILEDDDGTPFALDFGRPPFLRGEWGPYNRGRARSQGSDIMLVAQAEEGKNGPRFPTLPTRAICLILPVDNSR
jgi:hypothetical protein